LINTLTIDKKKALQEDLNLGEPDNDLGDLYVAKLRACTMLARWRDGIETAVQEGDEPLIFLCLPTPVTPSAPAPSAVSAPLPTPNDDHGDLLIRGLWSSATDCILDVRITDTDAKTYQAKDTVKVLASH